MREEEINDAIDVAVIQGKQAFSDYLYEHESYVTNNTVHDFMSCLRSELARVRFEPSSAIGRCMRLEFRLTIQQLINEALCIAEETFNRGLDDLAESLQADIESR